MIADSEILVVNKIAMSVEDNDDKDKRKRALHFVLPRKMTDALFILFHYICHQQYREQYFCRFFCSSSM